MRLQLISSGSKMCTDEPHPRPQGGRSCLSLRHERAIQMRFKLCSPKRRQLVSSAAAVVQLNISNPSAVRAPADWSGVKRARTRNEQLHERNLLFPRRSYFSVDFHLALFPQAIRTLQAPRSAAEDELPNQWWAAAK
jgi:hypothetical protein